MSKCRCTCHAVHVRSEDHCSKLSHHKGPSMELGGKCLLACPDTVIIKKLSCFNNNLEAVKKSHTKEGHREVSCGTEMTLTRHPIASGVAMGTVTLSGLLPHPKVRALEKP